MLLVLLDTVNFVAGESMDSKVKIMRAVFFQKTRVNNTLFLASVIGLTSLVSVDAATVYQNTFDDSDSLDAFTVYDGELATSHPAHSPLVSVDEGQLRIHSDARHPAGTTCLMGNTTTLFSPSYDPILSLNSGLIDWSFNVSNQDDAHYNSGFSFVLASTTENPFDSDEGFAQGYALTGGGMVGNRMALRRFDYGMGGSGETVVDITEGLAPLPEKGSFKITFNPATSEWSLYAQTGAEYTDPTQVGSLLGSSVDDTYTGIETKYFGLVGSHAGSSYFDNVTVDVVPEPASAIFMLSAFLGAAFIRRRMPA
jgi:hypothetical protein